MTDEESAPETPVTMDVVPFVPETETYCKVNLNELLKLRDSTKKLLMVLENIQSKTYAQGLAPDRQPKVTSLLTSGDEKIAANNLRVSSMSDLLGAVAIRNLEAQTKALDNIYIEQEVDDCSIYKRLTRKCTCLNRDEFNNLIIHFNEEAKYFTSNLGEIMKNIRILKKFLYMGGSYTNNSLTFLYEGLTKCVHTEKVEIAIACSHADICNILDEESMVETCIALPCKYSCFGDAKTQSLASAFMYYLARIEEGRRYLNFNSKTSTEIQRLLKKKSKKLDCATVERLEEIYKMLNPQLDRNINVTYYCKAEEGTASKVINGLEHFRDYMTLEEINSHLDFLLHTSKISSGVRELRQFIPKLLKVFKSLLLQYDENTININIAQIMINLTSKKPDNFDENKNVPYNNLLVADICTEPIAMRNQFNQIPSMRNFYARKRAKSKSRLKSKTAIKD